jgi:predicted site-specific integrase-resolvase
MLTLMSSFSNKLYGKRSAEMKKQRKLAKLAAEKAVVEQKEVIEA